MYCVFVETSKPSSDEPSSDDFLLELYLVGISAMI